MVKISTQRRTNRTAEDVLEVSKRSWEYSQALFDRTFHDFGAVNIQGEETVIFTFDLARVETVMTAIAHALIYRDFGRSYIGDWAICCGTLLSRKPAPDSEKLRATLPTRRTRVYPYLYLRSFNMAFSGAQVTDSWKLIQKMGEGVVLPENPIGFDCSGYEAINCESELAYGFACEIKGSSVF